MREKGARVIDPALFCARSFVFEESFPNNSASSRLADVRGFRPARLVNRAAQDSAPMTLLAAVSQAREYRPYASVERPRRLD